MKWRMHDINLTRIITIHLIIESLLRSEKLFTSPRALKRRAGWVNIASKPLIAEILSKLQRNRKQDYRYRIWLIFSHPKPHYRTSHILTGVLQIADASPIIRRSNSFEGSIEARWKISCRLQSASLSESSVYQIVLMTSFTKLQINLNYHLVGKNQDFGDQNS